MVYVMFSKVHYAVLSYCIVDLVERSGWSILTLLYVTPWCSTSILYVRSLKILIRQMQQTDHQMQQTDHQLNIPRPQTLPFRRLLLTLFNVTETKHLNISQILVPSKALRRTQTRHKKDMFLQLQRSSRYF
jgi:hypothetical protein